MVSVAVHTIYIHLFLWREGYVCIPLPPLLPTTPPLSPSSLSILYLFAKTHKHNNTFFCFCLKRWRSSMKSRCFPPFWFYCLQSSIQSSPTTMYNAYTRIIMEESFNKKTTRVKHTHTYLYKMDKYMH